MFVDFLQMYLCVFFFLTEIPNVCQHSSRFLNERLHIFVIYLSDGLRKKFVWKLQC